MGAGASAALDQSRDIDKQLQRDAVTEQSAVKLLLLGPGESGKSTILKQMRLLHLAGFSEEELCIHSALVKQKFVSAMTTLLEAMQTLQVPLADHMLEHDAETVLRFAKGFSSSSLPRHICESIIKLWHDAGVRACFKRSNEFQLEDSAEYFLNNAERISAPEYQATEQDMLRIRVETSGVVEVKFQMTNNQIFRVFDVGGQKSQRRKWIHCFDNVQAVIFISAISEFDQTLREDNTTNRLSDSIRLFGTVCNCKHFSNASMILFLNKKDIFAEKLATRSIKTLFPDYKGPPHDILASSVFLHKTFKSQNKMAGKRIYHHFTCATDTDQIKTVITATTEIITRENLKNVGVGV